MEEHPEQMDPDAERGRDLLRSTFVDGDVPPIPPDVAARVEQAVDAAWSERGVRDRRPSGIAAWVRRPVVGGAVALLAGLAVVVGLATSEFGSRDSSSDSSTTITAEGETTAQDDADFDGAASEAAGSVATAVPSPDSPELSTDAELADAPDSKSDKPAGDELNSMSAIAKRAADDEQDVSPACQLLGPVFAVFEDPPVWPLAGRTDAYSGCFTIEAR